MSRSISRRQFVTGAAVAVAAASAPSIFVRRAWAADALTLPPLPYADNALDPYITSNTVGFHYGKHHKGYVDTANKLLAGSDLAGQPLEAIIKAVAGDATKAPLFNATAQIWNHTFYWNSMRPKGGGAPSGALASKIDESFGGFDALKKALTEAAMTQFGSGWAWLVTDGKKLQVVKTANADTPIAHGLKPLLTIDVWEHAYYLDYQNRRADYVAAFLEHLANWDFAAQNLG